MIEFWLYHKRATNPERLGFAMRHTDPIYISKVLNQKPERTGEYIVKTIEDDDHEAPRNVCSGDEWLVQFPAKV